MNFLLVTVLYVALCHAQTVVRTIAGTTVRRFSDSGAFYWTGKMAIDADGASDAYHPQDKGIDFLANAGKPGNWWGITVSPSGTPYIQQSPDPHPGYYISSTSLLNKNYNTRRQCRFVDSRRISYVVVPNSSSFRNAVGVKIGDFGIIHYKGTLLYTMYADAGPSNKIGEGSIFAIDAIGKPNGHNQWVNGRVRAGISSGVTIVLFPKSGFGNGYIPTNGDINEHAMGAFIRFGGCAKLQQIVGTIPGCSLDKPKITQEVDYKCGDAGVKTMCGDGGQCASGATCSGWGGELVFGTAGCKKYPSHVACCTKPAPGSGASVPEPAPEPQPQPAPGDTVTAPAGSTACNAFTLTGTPLPGFCSAASACPAPYKHYPWTSGTTTVDAGCRWLPAGVRCCAPRGLGTDEVEEVAEEVESSANSAADGFAKLDPNAKDCSVDSGSGKCVHTNDCAKISGFESYARIAGCRSIPSRYIQCCAPKAEVSVSSGGGKCEDYKGLAFPLASGSLKEISANWGFSRSKGRRCHAGIDIYTSGARKVQAVAAGKVVGIVKNWYKCRKGYIDAIFVHHTSGVLAGTTINYGEVDPRTYSVRVGSSVSQGQNLGVASRCGMLHFEFYKGKRTANSRWYPASGRVGAGCHKTSMRSKPGVLNDPRPLLDCTKPRNARFRHGASFLEDADDNALFIEDAADDVEPEEGAVTDGESSGSESGSDSTTIAIVLVVVLLLLAVIGAAVAWLFIIKPRRQRSAGSRTSGGASIDFETAHESGGGAYVCNECGKAYDHADDLAAHAELRH